MERIRVPRPVARSLGGVAVVTAVSVWGAVTLAGAAGAGSWAVSQAWMAATLLTGALVASDALTWERRSLAGRLSSSGILVIWGAAVVSLVHVMGVPMPGMEGYVSIASSGYMAGAAALAAGLAMQARERRPEPVQRAASTATHLDEEPLVEALRSALKEARLSDPLTGLTTMYGLEEQGIPTAYEEAVLVIFNLDDLVWVNRRFGRKAGDEVMRQAAETLASALFGRACLARLGGDELLAVIPGGRQEGAELARVGRDAIRSMVLPRGGMEDFQMSVSVGMAQTSEPRLAAFSEALAIAEAAVDEAQLRGGDRVVWATPAGEPETYPEIQVDRASFG